MSPHVIFAAIATLSMVVSLVCSCVVLIRLSKVSSAVLGSGDAADEGRTLPRMEVVRCSADWHVPSPVQQDRAAAPALMERPIAVQAKLDNNVDMLSPRDARAPFVVTASGVSLRDATPSEVAPSLSEQMERIATSVIRKAMLPGGVLWRRNE